jgi:hypothetical protein
MIKMNPKIIAERNSSLILFEAGRVKTVPNTTYNQVKYRDYRGERIFYKFNETAYVQETYDNGIFNAFMKGETIQMRDGTQVTNSIQKHKENSNDDTFDKLFKNLYFIEKKHELMGEIIDIFGDRVETKTDKSDNEVYIVDGRFMVDDKGQSYYVNDLGTWQPLCTVAQGNLSKMTLQTKIGEIELGSTELTIMGKIGFLLTPDITDTVFFEQLTSKLKETLKAEIEAGV